MKTQEPYFFLNNLDLSICWKQTWTAQESHQQKHYVWPDNVAYRNK